MQEHGLRNLPTAFHPEKEGVVLRCEPAHEANTFNEIPTVYKIVEHLNNLCPIVPFHLVFGLRRDML